MKIVLSTYHPLFLFCLLSTLVIASGCVEEKPETSIQPQEYDGHNAICITTRTITQEGSTAENAIRTLRLIAFDAKEGGILLNKLYYTKDALSQVPAEYPYFAKDAGGEFHISEILPKTTIKFIMIANELNPPPANADTPEKIEKSVTNFYDSYQVGGKLNIGINGNNLSSNIGYIPMFAKTDNLIHHEWDASNQKTIEFSMKRLLAKVTLKLNKEQIDNPLFKKGDKLTITEAAIQHTPQYSYLGETGIQYIGSLVSTAAQLFDTPLVATTDNGKQSSSTLAFYIPEHVISNLSFANLQYTYLGISGTYYSDDSHETIATNYQIPLGNGLNKLFTGTVTDMTKLSQEDFAISRNTIYNIEANVTTIGKLEIFQVTATVKPWEGTIDIPGDIDAPVLNVSSINVKMATRTIRIHFWSNQPNPYMAEKGTDGNGNEIIVNNIFTNLHASQGTSTDHFKLLKQGDQSHLPYNGYMDIEFKDNNLYSTTNSYKVTLNAGRLQRTITITAQNIIVK